MEKLDNKNLYVFGYGLSIMIPFLVLFHSLREHLSFGYFLLAFLSGFILVMIIIERIANLKTVYNLWILVFQGLVLLHKVQNFGSGVPVILLGLAVLILGMTIHDVRLLFPLYNKWMTGAHFIGMIITSCILMILFYGVFGIVGIFLRLMRKDLLDQKLEPTRPSYWSKKEQTSFDKESYKKQF